MDVEKLTLRRPALRQKPKPALFTVGRHPPHSLAMPDAPDPPRKFYKFKPVDFENVNGVRQASSLDDTQPLPDPGIIESDKVRIDVRDLARAAKIPIASSAPTAPKPINEVHAVLQANLAKANAAGLNDVDLTPKRPSRRKRDYWLAAALGNAALAVAIMIQPIYGAAGVIIYNLGLTWTMWFVMDDY